jgi:hypothetical protein
MFKFITQWFHPKDDRAMARDQLSEAQRQLVLDLAEAESYRAEAKVRDTRAEMLTVRVKRLQKFLASGEAA